MSVQYASLFRFEGRVVIVTGAASGLGREISRALSELHADLVIADINAAGLEAAASELRGMAASVLVVPTDVSKSDQVNALMEAAKDVTGRIDALIHCAGIGGRSPAVEYSMELWDRVMSINATGTFLCMQAAGRVMLKQASAGSIINLSSVGGVVGKPGSVGYQVSKAMEIQLAKSLGNLRGGMDRAVLADGHRRAGDCPPYLRTSVAPCALGGSCWVAMRRGRKGSKRRLDTVSCSTTISGL